MSKTMNSERVRPELWPHSGLPVRELIAVNTGQIILVDGDYDGEYFAQYTWRVNPNVGWVQKANRFQNCPSNYLGRLVLGLKSGDKGWAHFLNGNKLDCRSANLAIASPGQIAISRGVGSGAGYGTKGGGISGYIGVQPYTYKGITKYQSVLNGEKRQTFLTALEAARNYDLRAYTKYGDYAVLNFPMMT